MLAPRQPRAGRSSLLVTTALTSTLAVLVAVGAGPVRAQQAHLPVVSVAPVTLGVGDFNPCVFDGECISVVTTGDNNTIDLTNDKLLDADPGGISGDAFNRGIVTTTSGANAGITITNLATGDIFADNGIGNTGFPASDVDNGMDVRTTGFGSGVTITNSGDVTAGYDGIYVLTTGGGSLLNPGGVTLKNYGVITTGDPGPISSGGEGIDIRTYTAIAPSPIDAEDPVPDALKVGSAFSPVTVINHGNIFSDDDGIEVCTAGLAGTNCRGGGGNSPVTVINTATIIANYVSIDSVTYGPASPIIYMNSGNLTANEEAIDAETSGDGSSITITNSGTVDAGIDGISAATGAYAEGHNSDIIIMNTGAITAGEVGIYASTGQNYTSDNSSIVITNSGSIVAGLIALENGHGIYAHTDGEGSSITIDNSGNITSNAGFNGIYAITEGDLVGVTVGIDIENTATISSPGESGVRVTNTGEIEATDVGIRIDNSGGTISGGLGSSPIEIVNEGSIAADSGLAIEVIGPNGAEIENAGLVTGFVNLSGGEDAFNNSAGATFLALGTSDFGTSDDAINNEGTVRTVEDGDAAETTNFANLEDFNNAGLLTLVDQGEGDIVTTDGRFTGLAGGKLAVDAVLEGPGSASDELHIGGDAGGKTAIVVNNLGTTGGSLNSVGIPVVTVTGSAGPGAFYLKGGPVDAGFFSFDLFQEAAGRAASSSFAASPAPAPTSCRSS